MACVIAITKVEGLNPDASGRPQTIKVYGTAIDCPGDRVAVGIQNQWINTVVDGNGNWEAEFPGGALCNAVIKVEAACAENRQCTTGSEQWKIICPPAECPTISLSMVGQDPCDETGLRPVKLQATLTNAPSPTIFEWDFGDGTTSNAQVFSTNPVEVIHAYDPSGGPYTVTLRIVYPEGCPSEDFTLRGINPCPSDCPDNVALEVRDSAGQLVNTDPDAPCLPVGDYTITVVQPPPSASISYSWSVDGTPVGQTGQSYTHTLTAAGAPSISVIVTPAGCPNLSDGLVLNECGQTPTPTPTPTPAPTPTPTPGPTSTPTPNGNDGGPCGSLVFIVAALLIAAAVGTIIAIAATTCPLIAASTTVSPAVIWGIVVGLGMAAALAIAIWLLLCAFGICPCPKKCDWLAIGWMVPLAAALISFYLSNCCPGFFLLAWLLSAAAAGDFAYWVYACKPSACRILDFLLVTVASVTAIVIGYIALIPAIAVCGSIAAAITVTTAAGLLGIAVPVCHTLSNNE